MTNIAPPWVAMLQAHADSAEADLASRAAADALPAIAALTFNADQRAVAQLEAVNHGRRRAALPPTPRQLARDITNSVVEEHLGRRPVRHRKEVQS